MNLLLSGSSFEGISTDVSISLLNFLDPVSRLELKRTCRGFHYLFWKVFANGIRLILHPAAVSSLISVLKRYNLESTVVSIESHIIPDLFLLTSFGALTELVLCKDKGDEQTCPDLNCMSGLRSLVLPSMEHAKLISSLSKLESLSIKDKFGGGDQLMMLLQPSLLTSLCINHLRPESVGLSQVMRFSGLRRLSFWPGAEEFDAGFVMRLSLLQDLELWCPRVDLRTLTSLLLTRLVIHHTTDDQPITSFTGLRTLHLRTYAPLSSLTRLSCAKLNSPLVLAPGLPLLTRLSLVEFVL